MRTRAERFGNLLLNLGITAMVVFLVYVYWDDIKGYIPFVKDYVPVSSTPAASTPFAFPTTDPTILDPYRTPTVGPPVIIEDPTPEVWPTLDPNPPPSATAQSADISSPYWCPYTNLWADNIDFSQLQILDIWNLTPGFYLERIVVADGSVKFIGLPYVSVTHADGIAYAHHPVCINGITNFPELNNLDGTGTNYSGMGGINLQLRKAPLCPNLDPVTGVSCSGDFLEKRLPNGLHAYPVSVPMSSAPTPIPPTIGFDTVPYRTEGMVYHIDSWITHTWAPGPNYAIDISTNYDQLVVTFVTQDGIARHANLLPIKTWWTGATDIVFGSCQNVPQGVEIPGRPGFCITGFNFGNNTR